MGSGFHLKAYDAGIVDDDRSDVQAVRSYGGEAETSALWHDDGTAIAEVVSRGACRRTDDEPVGLVGDEVVVVDKGTHCYHRCRVPFEDGDVVESVGTTLYGQVVFGGICLYL